MPAAVTGFASPDHAWAAQPHRTVMAQHGAPFQHAAPSFHPAPIQYAPPHGINMYRPAFPPQANHNQAVNPNLQRINPNLPPANPNALRPNLPLNNPSTLRPNFPLANPVGREPDLPSGNPGTPGPTPAPSGQNLIQQGAIPSGSDPVKAGSGPSPASQPVVIRPLLKPPPGGFPQTKPAFPAVQLQGKFWPLHKDSRSTWVRGQRRLFTPVASLGVILIGDSYWYPDAYVSMAGPACTGSASNGCQLQWRMVDFEDGGGEPQCVQYCPQAGPPPDEVATLPSPPPLAESGACQTTIYSEPNFAGNSAPTGDGQPVLSQSGWRNEISSIVVGAGTWDFFSDENFGGESMHLTPGTYPTLPAEWTRHIGSFMCVQPG